MASYDLHITQDDSGDPMLYCSMIGRTAVRKCRTQPSEEIWGSETIRDLLAIFIRPNWETNFRIADWRGTPIDMRQKCEEFFAPEGKKETRFLLLLPTNPPPVERKSNGRTPLWNGTVPVVISKKFPDYVAKHIRRAVERHHNNLTPTLNIVVREASQVGKKEDHIFFEVGKEGTGCTSPLGKQGGKQVIYLSRKCFNYHKIAHELMHSLGAIHQHQRPDAPLLLDINYANIRQDRMANYLPFSSDVYKYSGPLDPASLLMYPPRTSDSTRDVIIIKYKGHPGFREFGNAREESDHDFSYMKELYGIFENEV